MIIIVLAGFDMKVDVISECSNCHERKLCKRCSGCNVFWFCSPECCQKAMIRSHQRYCRVMRRLRFIIHQEHLAYGVIRCVLPIILFLKQFSHEWGKKFEVAFMFFFSLLLFMNEIVHI